MKKTLIFALSMCLISICRSQTVTLNIQSGIMSNSVGTVVPDGSLFQVIASPDATFAAPTAGSFTGGSNDIVIFSYAVNSVASGASGYVLTAPVINLSTYAIAGDFLELRWFPTLTTGSASPGGSTFYGQYGYAEQSTSAWIAPASGQTLSYAFLTTSAGGTLADTVGQAMSQTAPIPEPSTYAAIFGVAALGFVAYRRRQQAA